MHFPKIKHARFSILSSVICLGFLGCSAVGGGASSSQLDVEMRQASRMEVSPEVQKNSDALHSYLVGQLAYAGEDFDKAIVNFQKASELGGDMAPDLHVRLAELYLRSGKVDQALAESEKAIASEPNSPFNLLLKAGVLEALKRDKEAEPIYLKLITEQPKVSEPYVLLASLYSRRGELDSGTAILKKYLALNPKEPLAHYYLARAYESKNDWAQAGASYRKTIELSPDNLDLRIDLVRVLLRARKVDEARKICEAILQRDSGHVVARKILSELAIGSNQFDVALEHLEVVESEEHDPTETRFKIALIQIERQNFSEAIRELNLVLAQKPNHPEARYYLGSVYAGVGRNKEAVEEISKIKKGEPMFIKARTFLAFLLRHTGDLAGAEKASREALEADPGSKRIVAYLVVILREAKKFNEAADILKDAVAKDPADDRLLFQYAVVLGEKGDEQESRAMMDKVIEINPAHSDALNFIAYGMSERGEDLNKALSLVKKALEISPNDGFYLDTLGWIYYKQANFQEAETILSRAVDLTEQDLAVLEHYADCLVKTGKSKKAYEIYQVGLDKLKEKTSADDVETRERIQQKVDALKSEFPNLTKSQIQLPQSVN